MIYLICHLGWSPIFMLSGCFPLHLKIPRAYFTMRAVMLEITIDPAQFAGYEKGKDLY